MRQASGLTRPRRACQPEPQAAHQVFANGRQQELETLGPQDLFLGAAAGDLQAPCDNSSLSKVDTSRHIPLCRVGLSLQFVELHAQSLKPHRCSLALPRHGFCNDFLRDYIDHVSLAFFFRCGIGSASFVIFWIASPWLSVFRGGLPLLDPSSGHKRSPL